jgi:hypothetical protein
MELFGFAIEFSSFMTLGVSDYKIETVMEDVHHRLR